MGIPVDLNQRTNSICKEGSSRYGEEKTKLVPGARHGSNVYPFDSSGWRLSVQFSKPERHFSIRDVAAFLGHAALAQSFLFSGRNLPVRAPKQRGNKRLFKLHRSCPLKLPCLVLYPAIQDPSLRSAQLYCPAPPLFSKRLEPLP